MSDYSNYNYVELRDLCRNRRIAQAGNKIDMINRLEGFDKQQSSESAIAITTEIMPWVGKEQDPSVLQILPNISPPPGAIMRNGYGWNPVRLVGKYIESYTINSPSLSMTLYFTDSTTGVIHGSTSLFTTGHLHLDPSLTKALKTLTYDLGDECLEIVDAALGKRTTEISKSVRGHGLQKWREVHVVLGLRLHGMNEMGWVEYRAGENERWDPQVDDVWIGKLDEG